MLACNSISNIVAVQASWEKESERVLVRDCLASEVEFITTVAYEESVWTKVWGEKDVYIYMATDSTSVAVLDTCYERLKEDVLSFKERGLLTDFNTRVDQMMMM